MDARWPGIWIVLYCIVYVVYVVLMDCVALYCIALYCIVLYCIEGLCCIALYRICIEGWSRIWPSNEFIPHHTSAPPDHRPRVYKTKMKRITILDGTDHIHTAYCAILQVLLFSLSSCVSSERKRSIPMSLPPQQGQAQGG